MKFYARLLVLISLILIFCIANPGIAIALDAGSVDGDPDLPVDGGLAILITAGIGYGIKKVFEQRKKKSDTIR